MIFALVGAIILARSSIFVFWEQSFFDSNQAVIGLMAKHLTEMRAFPVFMYGQNYMLAVDRDAYVVAFLTNEQIIMASDRVRIQSYQREVAAHLGKAVRIERRPCIGGERVFSRIYFCPP